MFRGRRRRSRRKLKILDNLRSERFNLFGDDRCMAVIETERARPSPRTRTPRCATGCARSKPPRRLRPIRSDCSAMIIERAGANARRSAGAALRRRKPQLPRARGARQRYARWALEQGLAKGETVCLMMPNRPEYMAIWLGLTSVGRRRGADQHRASRAFACPLHRHRGAEACHRRRGLLPRRSATRRHSSMSRRKSGRMALTPAMNASASTARSSDCPEIR